MKQLDFPVSAEAVRTHGREFHEQDFFAAQVTTEQVDIFVSDSNSPPTDAAPTDPWCPGNQPISLAGDSIKNLARWTLVCIGLALAAAVMLSWLVRPDLKHVKWFDAAASATASKADQPTAPAMWR